MTIDDFIARWSASGGSERANFQQFAIELTQILEVPAPKPATADAQNDDYRFERPVTFIHTGTQSRGFIDLYWRGSFVMEAKQGTGTAPDEKLDLLGGVPAVQRRPRGGGPLSDACPGGAYPRLSQRPRPDRHLAVLQDSRPETATTPARRSSWAACPRPNG